MISDRPIYSLASKYKRNSTPKFPSGTGDESILSQCYFCMDSWLIPPVCRRCCQSVKCPWDLMTYYHLPSRLLMLDFLQLCPQELVMWLEKNLFFSENNAITKLHSQVPALLRSLYTSRILLGPFIINCKLPRENSSSTESKTGWAQKPVWV